MKLYEQTLERLRAHDLAVQRQIDVARDRAERSSTGGIRLFRLERVAQLTMRHEALRYRLQRLEATPEGGLGHFDQEAIHLEGEFEETANLASRVFLA